MSHRYEHYDDYSYLVKEDYYNEDVIVERFLFWLQITNDAIEEHGLIGKATVNERLLHNMVLSYFSDIVRLKEFHPIERANRIKIFAYSIYWFLRFSPVQLINEVDDKYLFINQKIVVDVYMAQFAKDIEELLDVNASSEYIEELYYFLKYRQYDAQTIEALIISFLTGAGKNPFSETIPSEK